MKLTLLYLSIFITSFCFSQNYIELDTTDINYRKQLSKKLDNHLKIIQKKNKKLYKGDFRQEVNSSYSNVFKNISKIVKDKEIVFNKIFTNYIDSITQTIVSNNKDIIKGKLIEPYVIRSNGLNAYSAGNSYVFLNMGIFKYLKNEAQLAAILSHEISHDILEHSKKSILASADLQTSKEKKKESKYLSKKKYNKQSEAFSLLKGVIYKSKKKKRKHEIEADSLGFLIYNNTKYSPKEFLNTLQVLYEYDSLPSISLKKENYKKFFDIPKQPFKDEWMTIENFDSYNYNHYKEKIDKDSIKTHPEILDRIDFIKKTFSNELNISKPFSNSITFDKLKHIAYYEDIMNLFYAKEYGVSLYLTLYKLKKEPDNKYFKKILAYNFLKLYKGKKEYKLNKYVDRLNPKEQDDSYMQFLSFIWNLNLNEMQNIFEFYQEK